MAMNNGVYTRTETRILAVLADGKPHTKTELMLCMHDELASPKAFRAHIHRIRGKLKMLGETILCELSPGIRYRHVRLLYNPNAD